MSHDPMHESKPSIWKLAEANYGQLKEMQFEVAVLPLGATEPHNYHLPYGTDLFEGTMIGEQACQFAAEKGAKVILLPTIPFGTETNMRKFPLAINLNPSTLNQVIADIQDSIADCGIKKMLLLNSHGGNDFKPLLRERAGQSPVHLFLCNWYQMIRDKYNEIFENPEDHAGEMETSFALAYFPQWVAKNADGSLAANDGSVRRFSLEALNQGWISVTRPWHLLTSSSGSGNPHLANEKKGRQLMQLLVDRIGGFLVELSDAKVDGTFPFTA